MFVFAKNVARTTGGCASNAEKWSLWRSLGRCWCSGVQVKASLTSSQRLHMQDDGAATVSGFLSKNPDPLPHLKRTHFHRVGQSFVLWLWIIVKRIGGGLSVFLSLMKPTQQGVPGNKQ